MKIMLALCLIFLSGCVSVKSELAINCDEIFLGRPPTVIHVPNTYCRSTSACDITFTVDRGVGGLKFQSLRIKNDKEPAIGFEISTEEVQSLIIAKMYADPDFLDGLRAIALYSDHAACKMRTMIELKYDIKGERLDVIFMGQWTERIK
jgi:hypothetical protein